MHVSIKRNRLSAAASDCGPLESDEEAIGARCRGTDAVTLGAGIPMLSDGRALPDFDCVWRERMSVEALWAERTSELAVTVAILLYLSTSF